jgi:hypothetical protein
MTTVTSLNTFSSTAEQAAAYQAWAMRIKTKGRREQLDQLPAPSAEERVAVSAGPGPDWSMEALLAGEPLR